MKLEQICKEIIEAGEKASQRPWKMSGEFKKSMSYKIHTPSGREWMIGDAIYHEIDRDAQYIVIAANNADKLARACLVMQEALEKYVEGPQYREVESVLNFCEDDCPSDCKRPEHLMIQKRRVRLVSLGTEMAKKALAEAEKIMGEE